MRVVFLSALVLGGLGAVVLAWRLRSTDATTAVVSAVAGAACVCLGVTLFVVGATTLVSFSWPLLVVTVVGAGLALWRARRLWKDSAQQPAPASTHSANLAIALGTGAAVAITLAAVQLFVTIVTETQRASEQDKSDKERWENLRGDFRFRVSSQRDLTGFSPPNDPQTRDLLDMSGYRLRGKVLANARLDEALLHGADFVYADLSRASLRDARLDRRPGDVRTDFRAATLYGADLRGAQLDGANLTEADLRLAFVDGADFAGAELGWADLRDLRCGPDTNNPQPCRPADLAALNLPPRSQAPATACYPDEDPERERAQCGAEARRQRGGRP